MTWVRSFANLRRDAAAGCEALSLNAEDEHALWKGAEDSGTLDRLRKAESAAGVLEETRGNSRTVHFKPDHRTGCGAGLHGIKDEYFRAARP